MSTYRSRLPLFALSLTVAFAGSSEAIAKTLCVNPSSPHSCYATIQSAVNAAANYDVIRVAAGTYKEGVTIWKPLSLLGAGARLSVIDASGQGNGILLDGYNHPGLKDVTIAGFTVKNALYEGVLAVSVADATIRDNRILNNDKIGAKFGSGPACKGQPAYETDESGDCGGGLHLIGVWRSVVSGNYLSGNADGILISDETAESRGNLLIRNVANDNPLECGIVLASHPPVGSAPPNFARHYGVDGNTVAENSANRNGVKVGGAGIGLFSDGAGPGRVSGNVIIRNVATGNGIPGVSLHTHVGPAFKLPADNMDDNKIIGNYLAGNGPDTDDTATNGRAGININSGGGGTPVRGTIISQNVIRDEDIDVAVNTPSEVDVHLNDLLGGKVGVANVCALDKASCAGSVDATQNFWGCAAGPGKGGCSTVAGSGVRFVPWLGYPATDATSVHP